MKTLISWKIEGFDNNTGERIHLYESDNLQVNAGKIQTLNWIGHLGTTAASGFTFMMFGPCANAPVVTDSRLGGSTGYEYVANGARYTITNWVVSAENFTPDTGITNYTQKMTGSTVIDGSIDANATNPTGSPIQSYGLNSTWVLPTNPTNTSGTMLNELVDANQFLLKSGASSNKLTVTIVLRQ